MLASNPAYVMPTQYEPRVTCNFQDARDFVVICRVHPSTTMSDVVKWVLEALWTSTHTAAFDTYNRTKSAWVIRFSRECSDEIKAYITLKWQGRRFVDLEALTFVSDIPRAKPLMNACEVLWLLKTSGIHPCINALGVSGVAPDLMGELLDELSSDESMEYVLDDQWCWTKRDPRTKLITSVLEMLQPCV